MQGYSEFDRLKAFYDWDVAQRAENIQDVWVPLSANTQNVSFPEEGQEELAELETQSYWFNYRNKIIQDQLLVRDLPTSFWEIGAGNGFVSLAIQVLGIQCVAVEPIASGAFCAKKRGVGVVINGFFEQLQLPDKCLPAIGCFDVIEHLDDPSTLLNEIYRTLEPKGLLLVTVPAFKHLWTYMDDFAGHFHRYSKKQLDDLVLQSGFAKLRSSYFMACLVPPLILHRKIPSLLNRKASSVDIIQRAELEHSSTGSKLAFRVLAPILELERQCLKRVSLPFGTSIIGVYQRS